MRPQRRISSFYDFNERDFRSSPVKNTYTFKGCALYKNHLKTLMFDSYLSVLFYLFLMIFLLVPNRSLAIQNYNIHLVQGWNSFSLPFYPAQPIRASDLADIINSTESNCLIILAWQGGQWDPFTPGAGEGFLIEPGIAYFLYCKNATTIQLQGEPAVCQPVTLLPGWNAFGSYLEELYSASELFQSFKDQGCHPVLIQKWQGGQWNPYVPGGLNFPIERGEGAFIYNESSTDEAWIGDCLIIDDPSVDLKYINDPYINISGEGRDGTIWVDVNGKTKVVEGKILNGKFSVNVPLYEGENHLSIYRDPSRFKDLIVYYDPPEHQTRFHILTPKQGDVISSNVVRVEGYTNEKDASIVINNNIATQDAFGHFYLDGIHLPNESAENEIVVTLTTIEGEVETKIITVIRDTTPPQINITRPNMMRQLVYDSASDFSLLDMVDLMDDGKGNILLERESDWIWKRLSTFSYPTCMAEDPITDTIWIGAQQGLYQFFGTAYEIWTESNGLVSNYVNDLAVDTSGNLWIATNGGIGFFDGSHWGRYTIEGMEIYDGQWKSPEKPGDIPFQDSGIESIPTNIIKALAVEHRGTGDRIWFATNLGFMAISNNGFEEFIDPNEKKPLSSTKKPSETVNSLIFTSLGKLIAGTELGLVTFTPETGKWNYISTGNGLTNDKVYSIAEDEKGRIWIGTLSGLNRMDNDPDEDPNNPIKISYQYTTQNGALNNNTVKAIEITEAGEVYVGTEKGMCSYNGLAWNHWTYNHETYPWFIDPDIVTPAGTGFNCILIDSEGQKWIATWQHLFLHYQPFLPQGQLIITTSFDMVLEWALLKTEASFPNEAAHITVFARTAPTREDLSGMSFVPVGMDTYQMNLPLLMGDSPSNPWIDIKLRFDIDTDIDKDRALSPILDSLTLVLEEIPMVRDPNIRIAGFIDDRYPDTVKVNGQEALTYGQYFQIEHLALIEGENYLTIMAKDKAGNTAEKEITLFLDLTKPLIDVFYPVYEPGKPLTIVSSPFIVHGAVYEDTARVIINNEEIYVGKEDSSHPGRWDFWHSLSEGDIEDNEFSVIAIDEAGNQEEKIVKVNFEDNPIIMITNPSESSTSESFIIIEGYLLDRYYGERDVEVTINDHPAVVTQRTQPDVHGSFRTFRSMDTLTLTEGENEFLIYAEYDSGQGQQASKTIKIFSDTEAPFILLTNPALPPSQEECLWTTENKIAISGFVQDDNPDMDLLVSFMTYPQLEELESKELKGPGKFSLAPVDLVLGMNRYLLSVKDSSNKISEEILCLERTETPPDTYLRITGLSFQPGETFPHPDANIKWDFDAQGITGPVTFHVTLSGQESRQETTTEKHLLLENLADGLYFLSLTAEGSGQSSPEIMTYFFVDTTAPNIILWQDPNDSTMVSFKWKVEDNLAPINQIQHQYRFDCSYWQDVNINGIDPVTGEVIAQYESLEKGCQYFMVKASDIAGNMSKAVILIDREAPEVEFLSAPYGRINYRDVEFVYKGIDDLRIDQRFTFKTCLYHINIQDAEKEPPYGTMIIEWFDPNDSEEMEYVSILDDEMQGDWSPNKIRYFDLDSDISLKRHQLRVLSKKTDQTEITETVIEFDLDPNGWYLKDFNKELLFPWTEWSEEQSVIYRGLEDGIYEFQVRAMDGIGRNSLIYKREFIVETKDPNMRILNFDPQGFPYIINLDKPYTDLQLVIENQNPKIVSLNEQMLQGLQFYIQPTHIPFSILYSIPRNFSQDGNNLVKISTVDSMGNIRQYHIDYQLKEIDIAWPKDGEIIKFSPITLYGKISENFSDLTIIVKGEINQIKACMNCWQKEEGSIKGNFAADCLKIKDGLNKIKIEVMDNQNTILFTRALQIVGEDISKPVVLSILDTNTNLEIRSGDSPLKVQLEAEVFLDTTDIILYEWDFDGDGLFEVTEEDRSKINYQEVQYRDVGIQKPTVRITPLESFNQGYIDQKQLVITNSSILELNKKITGNGDDISIIEDPATLYIMDSDKIMFYEIKKGQDEIGDDIIHLSEFSNKVLRPERLLVRKDKTILLTDPDAGRIVVFEPGPSGFYNDKGIWYITKNLIEPSAMAFDPNGMLFVCDRAGNRIIRYAFNKCDPNNPDAIETEEWTSFITPFGEETFNRPEDILIRNGYCYVADSGNHRIIKLTLSGEYRYIWGDQLIKGESDTFDNPRGITVDPDSDLLFVADTDNGRVQLFDANGPFLLTLFFSDKPISIDFIKYMNKKYLYVVNETAVNNESIRNVLKLDISFLMDLSKSTYSFSKKMVFVRNNDIFLTNDDGTNLRRVTFTGTSGGLGLAKYPCWYPDGSKIAFVLKSPQTIGFDVGRSALVDFDLKEPGVLNILKGGEGDFEAPFYSSDGKKIVYSYASLEGDSDIHLIFQNDPNQTYNLTKNSLKDDLGPSYSYYGNYIAYTSDTELKMLLLDPNEPGKIPPTWDVKFKDEIGEIKIIHGHNPILFIPPSYWALDVSDTITEFYSKYKPRLIFSSRLNSLEGMNPEYNFDVVSLGLAGHELLEIDDPSQNIIELTDMFETDRDITNTHPSISSDGERLIYSAGGSIHSIAINRKGEVNRNECVNDYEKCLTELTTGTNDSWPSFSKDIIIGLQAHVVEGPDVDGINISLEWQRHPYLNLEYYVYFKHVASSDFTRKYAGNNHQYMITNIDDLLNDYTGKWIILVEGRNETTNDIFYSNLYEINIDACYACFECEELAEERNSYKLICDAKCSKGKDLNYTWIFSEGIRDEQYGASNRIQIVKYPKSGDYKIVLTVQKASNPNLSDKEERLVTIRKDLNPTGIHYTVEEKLPKVWKVKFSFDPNEIGILYREDPEVGYIPPNFSLQKSVWQWGDGVEKTSLVSYSDYYDYPLTGKNKSYEVKLIIKAFGSQEGIKYDSSESTCFVRIGSDPLEAIIDYEIIDTNGGMKVVKFSAASSNGGGIDWNRCKWRFHDSESDGPTVQKVYPLASERKFYPVTLTIYRYTIDGGQEEDSITKVIAIDRDPLRPVISYSKENPGDPNSRTYIFSAELSEGGNIAWSETKWEFSENIPPQYGPVIMYTFSPTQEDKDYLVTLILKRIINRVEGKEEFAKTSRIINVKADPLVPVINYRIDKAENIIFLDAFESLGEGIQWKDCEWVVGDQIMDDNGPCVKHPYDPMSITKRYKVILYIMRNTIDGTEVKSTEKYIEIEADELKPVIDYRIEEVNSRPSGNVVFSAVNSLGSNIDWQRCTWHFPDYAQILHGTTVSFSYLLEEDVFQHPVILEIFRRDYRGLIKESATEKIYVQLQANPLVPIIRYERKPDGRTFIFSATQSLGDRIIWSDTKWTFGDGRGELGPVVSHVYPTEGRDRKYIVTLTLSRPSLMYPPREVKTVTKEIGVAGDRLIARFSYKRIKTDPDAVKIQFDASASEGENIDWSVCTWNFGEKWESYEYSYGSSNTSRRTSFSNSAAGPVVEHWFARNAGQYRPVTLTIYRIDLTTTRPTSYNSVTQTINILK